MTRAGGTPTAVEALLRRDSAQYLAAPLLASALAWAWLVPAAIDMYGSMDGLSAWMMDARWDLRYGLMIFAMWAAMMVAMMLPSLAPALLLYGNVCRSDPSSSPVLRVYAFALGYVGAWTAFSAAATLVQWQLSRSGLMNMMMELGDRRVAGAVMILAGVYQWTPLKQACLSRCQSPAHFISANWRRGPRGAAALGLHYGLYCLGCCWALMLLLFACGVMHLGYILLLSVLVLLEKVAPWGRNASRAVGALLVAAGVYTLVG